jgi:tetratricopeptide (TPR) repeat protein
LYIFLGDLNSSKSAAESCFFYALRAKNKWKECGSLVFKAWVKHLLGDSDAQLNFQDAEKIHQQIKDTSYLYGLWDILHADHLRRQGQTEYARRITEENLIICERNNWPDRLSQSHWLMGHLDADNNVPSAQSHYNQALSIARSISKRDTLIEALLARGRWAARREEVDIANKDLKEALGYALASSYRIYEIDIRIGLAWMHRSGNINKARKEAEKSQIMSQEIGYHWGQVDAAEVLAALTMAK